MMRLNRLAVTQYPFPQSSGTISQASPTRAEGTLFASVPAPSSSVWNAPGARTSNRPGGVPGASRTARKRSSRNSRSRGNRTPTVCTDATPGSQRPWPTGSERLPNTPLPFSHHPPARATTATVRPVGR